MELKDKAVLVTGGGGGIGLGIALALAREGCRVAITGRNEEKLRAAAAQFGGPPAIRCHACDVSNRKDVEELFTWLDAELGPLDILVNNAGITVPNRRMSQLTPGDWDRMLAVNVTGAFNCIHAALPAMRDTSVWAIGCPITGMCQSKLSERDNMQHCGLDGCRPIVRQGRKLGTTMSHDALLEDEVSLSCPILYYNHAARRSLCFSRPPSDSWQTTSSSSKCSIDAGGGRSAMMGTLPRPLCGLSIYTELLEFPEDTSIPPTGGLGHLDDELADLF